MTRIILLALVLIACSDSAGPPPLPPPPPAIVKLIVTDSQPGFWRGDSLSLAQLVTRAIDAEGDTVAAPAVTWTVPDGFARAGNMVRATREARGPLVVSATGIPSISLTVASMDNLAERAGWSGGYTCYGGTWDATRTTDTVVYQFHEGSVHYSDAPWAPGTFQAEFRFDSVTTIAYLSDGSIATIGSRPNNGDRHNFQQDTLSLRLIASTDTVPMRRKIDSPAVYESHAPICRVGTGWKRDGTPWELSMP